MSAVGWVVWAIPIFCVYNIAGILWLYYIIGYSKSAAIIVGTLCTWVPVVLIGWGVKVVVISLVDWCCEGNIDFSFTEALLTILS